MVKLAALVQTAIKGGRKRGLMLPVAFAFLPFMLEVLPVTNLG